MYWGYSPALDLQQNLISGKDDEPLNILIIGSSDARHVLKTVASRYLHQSKRIITFHVVEQPLENIARSILLLNICFETNLGLQEATRYYLEILGNTLLRPATAKFLISRAKALIDVVTDTKLCNWLNLKHLKYKHRDALEYLFKFWAIGASENILTSKIWDLQVRRFLGQRYDYKNGAFDWDYYMILKPRGIKHLSSHEYVFWRENGVAFVWIEGDPVRGNPTLISLNQNMVQFFGGDIRNGPFFTWINDSNEKENSNINRISDVAEKEVMSAIYEVHKKECMDDKMYAAHRDASLANGVIMIKLDDPSSEQESWSNSEIIKTKKSDLSWIDLDGIKVNFYDITALNKMKMQEKKFDCIWIGQQIPKEHRNIYDLLKEKGILLTETRQFLVEYKDEEIQQFKLDLKKDATDNGFHEIENMHETILSFVK